MKMPISLLTLALTLTLATASPPTPAHYVTDQAGVLDEKTQNELNARLAAFELETSNQVIVYVDRTLNGEDVDLATTQWMHDWGIGQAGKNNGMGLFIFTGDRKTAIRTGYGLQEVFPASTAKNILDTVLRPLLRQGDYRTGIQESVGRIIAVLTMAQHPELTPAPPAEAKVPARESMDLYWWICGAVGLIAIVGFIIYRRMAWKRADAREQEVRTEARWADSARAVERQHAQAEERRQAEETERRLADLASTFPAVRPIPVQAIPPPVQQTGNELCVCGHTRNHHFTSGKCGSNNSSLTSCRCIYYRAAGPVIPRAAAPAPRAAREDDEPSPSATYISVASPLYASPGVVEPGRDSGSSSGSDSGSSDNSSSSGSNDSSSSSGTDFSPGGGGDASGGASSDY